MSSQIPDNPEGEELRRPSIQPVEISANVSYQAPLTYRGHGPGLIVILPQLEALPSSHKQPLDPLPRQKWAEEGFGVVQLVGLTDNIEEALKQASAYLEKESTVDTKDKQGLIVYDPAVLDAVCQAAESAFATPPVLVSYGAAPKSTTLHAISHVPQSKAGNGAVQADTQSTAAKKPKAQVFSYDIASPLFVLPQTTDYAHSPAALAHTRTLKHVKNFFDGPWFDLEQIWEEHISYEFADRAVPKTMATMVEEPYVNHVPTLTGGIGRKALTSFYAHRFIYSNPPDLVRRKLHGHFCCLFMLKQEIELISRTVGIDRVIDEFIWKMTHDRQVDWFFPGIPATGKWIEVPFVSVVNIRGDRLFHEHIWWEHATALAQIGVLPTHVPFQGKMLRLPVAGIEAAQKLRDPEHVPSNEMFGSAYGLQEGAGVSNGVNGNSEH